MLTVGLTTVNLWLTRPTAAYNYVSAKTLTWGSNQLTSSVDHHRKWFIIEAFPWQPQFIATWVWLCMYMYMIVFCGMYSVFCWGFFAIRRWCHIALCVVGSSGDVAMHMWLACVLYKHAVWPLLLYNAHTDSGSSTLASYSLVHTYMYSQISHLLHMYRILQPWLPVPGPSSQFLYYHASYMHVQPTYF